MRCHTQSGNGKGAAYGKDDNQPNENPGDGASGVFIWCRMDTAFSFA